VRAVLAAATLLGFAAAGEAGAQEAFSIDVNSLNSNGCFGQGSCSVDEADVSALGSTLTQKSNNGDTGFGVSGGASGGEIDVGETLRVDFDQSREIVAIQILFLYNGPEYGDLAEKAQVTADGTVYTLSVQNDADDAAAVWSGAGATVTKCGDTTGTGTGCFIVTDPFPDAVERLDFTAIPGAHSYPYSYPNGTNESDYAIGYIDVAARNIIELQDCTGTEGCSVIPPVNGNVAFDLSGVQAQNPGGSTEAQVIPVRLPDCRYIPQACLDLLPPASDTAATDDGKRALLIGLGVIKPLDPSGPNKLNPAAQLLNVTPLLPVEVTSLYDTSGVAPNGLPPLYLSARWRGQAGNDYLFDGYFFRTDSGVVFSDVFEGLIDVSVLTGHELGCFTDTGNLLAWDVMSTVSELAKSVDARYRDSMINVGCINPTKVAGTRLSLYSINLEMVPTTYGPTIKSFSPKVTVNNDAVFARLVQSLWRDLGDVRANYACKQADPTPSGGMAPLSKAVCNKLAGLWAIAAIKNDLCVLTTFGQSNAAQASICGSAKQAVIAFEAAIPATATGPDPYNRLGELQARTDVFQHVWDERFLKSIKALGFCREKGTCAP
jgi:hypothetical protein